MTLRLRSLGNIFGAVATLAAATCLILGIFPLRVDGDSRSLLPVHSQGRIQFEELRRLFGENSLETVVVDTSSYRETNKKSQLRELGKKLEAVPGVLSVLSPADAFGRKTKLPLAVWTQDRQSGRFLLEVHGDLTAIDAENLHHAIDATLAGYPDLRPRRSGTAYLNYVGALQIRKEIWRLFLYVVGIILAFLWLRWKSVRDALAALLPPTAALIWALVSIALTGVPLGQVSLLAPILILLIGLGFSLSLADSPSGPNKTKQLRALLLSAAITIFGFLSLLMLNIIDVARFSLLVSWGVALSALFAIAFTPQLFTARQKSEKIALKQSLTLVSLPNLVLFGIALGILLLRVGHLRIDVDPLQLLPQKSTTRNTVESALAAFPSNKTLSVVLSRSDSKPLADDDLLVARRLRERFEKHVDVFDAVSSPDIEAFNTQKLSRPPSAGQERSVLSADSFITADRMATRILVETSQDGEDLLRLRDELISIIRAQIALGPQGFTQEEPDFSPKKYTDLPENPIPVDTYEESGQEVSLPAATATPAYINPLDISILSLDLLRVSQYKQLIGDMHHALLALLAAAVVILAIICRNIALTLVGCGAILIPVIATFGAAGWLFGVVSVGSSLVLVTGLALSLDETMTFFLNLRDIRKEEGSNREQAFNAMVETIATSWISTVVLVLGSLALALTDVTPLRHFAVLLVVALISGFLANALYLPIVSRYFINVSRRADR